MKLFKQMIEDITDDYDVELILKVIIRTAIIAAIMLSLIIKH
jgi:hypothetical protein